MRCVRSLGSGQAQVRSQHHVQVDLVAGLRVRVRVRGKVGRVSIRSTQTKSALENNTKVLVL